MDYRSIDSQRTFLPIVPVSPPPPLTFQFSCQYVTTVYVCTCVIPLFFSSFHQFSRFSPCICVSIENVIIFYDNFIYLLDKNKNLILYCYTGISYTFFNSKIPAFFFLQVRNISNRYLFRRFIFYDNIMELRFVL